MCRVCIMICHACLRNTLGGFRSTVHLTIMYSLVLSELQRKALIYLGPITPWNHVGCYTVIQKPGCVRRHSSTTAGSGDSYLAWLLRRVADCTLLGIPAARLLKSHWLYLSVLKCAATSFVLPWPAGHSFPLHFLRKIEPKNSFKTLPHLCKKPKTQTVTCIKHTLRWASIVTQRYTATLICCPEQTMVTRWRKFPLSFISVHWRQSWAVTSYWQPVLGSN